MAVEGKGRARQRKWLMSRGCWCQDCAYYQPKSITSFHRVCGKTGKRLRQVTGCMDGVNKNLPVCPRCNHRHRLELDEKKELTDSCPYCSCPLHYDVEEEAYLL